MSSTAEQTRSLATSAASVITQSHEQVVTVTATHPDWFAAVPLRVRTGTVSMDETRSPRVTASLLVGTDDSAGLARLIDPRLGVRVQISAGYTDSDGRTLIEPLADLGVRSISQATGDGGVTITAASDEAKLIDAAPVVVPMADMQGKPEDLIARLITQTIKPSPTLIVDPAVTGEPPVLLQSVTDRWDAAVDLADVINAQLFDPGNRRLYLRATPELAARVPDHTLVDGVNGTIIACSTTVDRDRFANRVAVRYRWKDANDVERVIVGNAVQTRGEYAVTGRAGTRILVVDRSRQITQAFADRVARAMLVRSLSRVRTTTVTAINAFWLRPGMTVRVQTTDVARADALVQSVTYNLVDGTMSLQTRVPDPAGSAWITNDADDTNFAQQIIYTTEWLASDSRVYREDGVPRSDADVGQNIVAGRHYSLRYGRQRTVLAFSAANANPADDSIGDKSVTIPVALAGNARLVRAELRLTARETGGRITVSGRAGTAVPATMPTPRTNPGHAWPDIRAGEPQWLDITSAALLSLLKAGNTLVVLGIPAYYSTDWYSVMRSEATGLVWERPMLRLTYVKTI